MLVLESKYKKKRKKNFWIHVKTSVLKAVL